MTTGKIKVIKNGYGFIKQDDGGPDVYFKVGWVKNISPTEVTEGLQVEYEAQKTDKGLQTEWIRALETGTRHKQSQPTPQRLSRQPLNDVYHFLNPYNFVRFLQEPKQKDIKQSVKTQLLWHCSPPPHDRYIGLTGRIECEVEAITPLFVSDSHGVEDKDHKTYRFFQYDNKPALPASSLRGMIRSVFEAVTNSCLGAFEGQPLTHRFPSDKSPWLVPARVEKIDNEWKLRLLPGEGKLNDVYEASKGTRKGDQYPAWIYRYWPINPSKTLSNPPTRKNVNFVNRRQPGNELDIGQFQHGQKCFALLKKVIHALPAIKFWDVVALSANQQDMERERQKLLQDRRNKPSDLIVREGWLCLHNQNIETKHSERFFFPADSNQILDLSKSVRKAYEKLIEKYQEDHQKRIAELKHQKINVSQPIPKKGGNNEPAFSRFIYTESAKELNDGALVYALITNPDNPQVDFIAPVAVPRIRYEKNIGDLLSDHLHHCKNYEELCLACRTFGWVWKRQDKEENQPDLTAYASRVRFSHGQLTHKAGTLPDNTTLAILSTPKPTTTLFYLLKNGQPDSGVDYNDDNAQLRGRKVYRHHGNQLNQKEYTRASNGEQNRTVRGALDKGSTFTFTIDFENLAEVELGALLWVLEFDGDGTMFHRLGYAKPLGFGSVKIEVTKVERFYPEQRYTSLESWDAGWQEIGSDQLDRWKQLFKETLTVLYGEFDKLPPVEDLRVLLCEPKTNLPIHYPRPKREPSSEENNYEWFMGNKNHHKQSLPLPDQDTVGFPYWDKNGREDS